MIGTCVAPVGGSAALYDAGGGYGSVEWKSLLGDGHIKRGEGEKRARREGEGKGDEEGGEGGEDGDVEGHG